MLQFSREREGVFWEPSLGRISRESHGKGGAFVQLQMVTNIQDGEYIFSRDGGGGGGPGDGEQA